jgi:hypothetical protein
VVEKISRLPSERGEFGHDARPLPESLFEGLRVVEAADFLTPAQSVSARHLKPKKRDARVCRNSFCPRIKAFLALGCFTCRRAKEKVAAFYQHVNAVGADYAYEQGSEEADQPAGVLEGIRHRQDACSEAALEKVQQGLGVAEIGKKYQN